jgi:uncharacterized protein DUF5317
MVFLPVLAVAVLVGLALGGRVGALASIRLRAMPLLYAAIALQLVAFPPAFFPFDMDGWPSRALWLASYACLLTAGLLNLHLRGIVLVLAGIAANVIAVTANGGVMPALPEAARDAGMQAPATYNSVTQADPHLSWLVDRWAAPEWVPFANVVSIGDILLAVGGFVLVLSAMKVPLLRRVDPQAAGSD